MSSRPRSVCFVAIVIVSCLVGPRGLAQRLERGAILVASPALGDTTFVESVILLLDHAPDEGSIGVIINRPTNLAPAQVFPDSGVTDYAGTVFYGGPVMPTRAFLLLRERGSEDDGLVPILEEVQLSGGFDPVATLRADERTAGRVRIYAGHARWGPGQLAAEIASGAWVATRGTATLVFDETPLALWRTLQSLPTGREDIVQLR